VGVSTFLREAGLRRARGSYAFAVDGYSGTTASTEPVTEPELLIKWYA